MRYRQFRPRGPASEFVECYWTLEQHSSDTVQRVVPDGTPELILNLGSPFSSLKDGVWQTQPEIFLAGQLTRPLLLRPTGPARMIGVRLTPHGAAQLLRIPMQACNDSFAPLSELSPRLGRALDRVRESGRAEDLDAALRPAADSDLRVAEAVRMIVGGATDIAQIAADLNLSTRQFERRFKERVGIPPKLFSRMQRFQRVFRAIDAGRPDWARAAAECGYHDQAHLIRDFRDFAGETPSVLLAGDDLARHFLRYPGVSHSYNTGSRGA